MPITLHMLNVLHQKIAGSHETPFLNLCNKQQSHFQHIDRLCIIICFRARFRYIDPIETDLNSDDALLLA